MRARNMRFPTFLGALALVAANAWAEPPTPESVETLLAATRAESMMNSMYTVIEQSMRGGMRQSLQGQTLTDEQQRVLDAVPGKFIAVMREEFNWSKMKPLYVQLYRETFDQAEIDGLIAFYRTPVGQSFIEKMPVVMQKSMAATQTLMAPLIAKMRAAMDKAMAEAKAQK